MDLGTKQVARLHRTFSTTGRNRKGRLTFQGAPKAPLILRKRLSHLHWESFSILPAIANLHHCPLLTLAFPDFALGLARTSGQLTPGSSTSHSSGNSSSFFPFLGICLPPGLGGLFCPSFVLLLLWSNPLFVLGDDQHSHMIVSSTSL